MAAEEVTLKPIDPGLARRAFHDGDPAAYSELVRLLEPRLRGHAARLLGPDRRNEVGDLLQGTLEHLHRSAAILDDDRPVEAWAFVIMRNLSVDWHRAESRRPRMSSALDDHDVAQPGQSDVDEARALLFDLDNAVRDLPPNRRLLVELVYFQDRPLSEAAATSEMTYGAARYQLNAALRQLRAALGLQIDNNPIAPMTRTGTAHE